MVVTDTNGSSSLAQAFDSLTPQQMRERGSLKWSQYPGDVVGAWVAEMDLGTAPAVEAAIHQAMRHGLLGYMPPSVSQRVREETVRYQREAFGWEVEVEQVSLLPDVLSSLSAVITSHTSEGSPIIVPTPAYMPFLEIPGRHRRECIEVPSVTRPSRDGSPSWELDLDGVEAAMATGAGLLVLCNPWNPVGRILTPVELDAVAALSSRHRVPVFADEIHSSLVLDPTAAHTPYGSRPAAEDDLTFTATAVSKGWNIPGLMCAQLIASGGARASWEASALSAHLADEAAALGARAAVAALSAEGLAWNRMVRDYIRGNRDLMAEALDEVEAVEMTAPAGTYLAWLDCSGLDLGDMAPARFFRREPGVAMNPGAAFGRGYERFCRLNLATGRGIAARIAQRLVEAIRVPRA